MSPAIDRLIDMAWYARVVELGSFSAAAGSLGLSRSALSKAVNRLEAHLGLRLLNRTTRKLTPTEAGLAFHAYCRQVVDSAEQAEHHLGQLRNTPQGLLRMTAPLSFGLQRVVPLLPRLLALHPGLRVNLVVDDRPLDLVGEGFDLALRFGTPVDGRLVARRLLDIDGVVVAAPAYLRRAGTPLQPSDLLQHQCLDFAERAPGRPWEFVGPSGPQAVRIDARLVLNSTLGLRDAALAGLGITMLARYLVEDDLGAGRLIRLLPDHHGPAAPLFAVYPHRRHLATKVKVALEFFAGAWA